MSQEARTGSLHYFFPVVVQATEVEHADALNADLVATVDRVRAQVPNARPDSWSCDVYTTISSPAAIELQAQPAFDRLKTIIAEEAFKYGKTLGLAVDRFPPRVDDFWVNVYGRGNAQEVHTHGNSVFSGIYYVKAPPGCGDTLFHAPMGDAMLDPPRAELNPFNASVARWSPRAGQMLFFRGWLKHSVQANDIDEERITIAFNVNL